MRVSILTPVYGTERLIEQCAVSLFEQTYPDIEYVFVDDCTPDRSIEVLKEVMSRYPDRQPDVRIIRHDKNRGLGAARRTGLHACTGEFVLQTDADDYLPCDAVERMVEAQVQTNADIVSGRFLYLYPDGTTAPSASLAGMSQQTVIRCLLIQHTISHSIWARLVRRALYADGGIDAVEGIDMAEDYALTTQLFLAANKTVAIDGVVYVYRLSSPTSTFQGVSRRHIISMLKANEEVRRYYSEHDSAGEYGYPLELGMLNATQQALAAGLTKAEIATHLHYKPCRWLFRLCHALLAHRHTHLLLRFTYLSLKWFYKKAIIRRTLGK